MLVTLIIHGDKTPDGLSVVISINDSGPGIRAEDRVHIFEPYHQGERNYRSRRFGSLGLGLFVTKAIIEAHGGSANQQNGALCVRLPLST